MNLHLTYVLTTAACLVALACGHEARTSAGLRAEPPVIAIPIATTPAPEPVRALPETTAAAATPSADDCIEVDTELGGKHVALEGRVFVDQAFEHPARGKTHPYILRLDAARCATGIEDARVTEVALASSEGVALKPLVGKHVRVAGDPFVAHTAWHARPIVLMTTTATRLP